MNEPKRSDPISILVEAFQGQAFRCVEYATVLNGCLNALGIYARVLSLKTQDCETREYGAGHVVVEAYIPKLEKWIMADPQFNVMAYDDKGPLNAVELAQSDKHAITIEQTFSDHFTYYDWIMPYLYYFTVPFDNRIDDPQPSGEKEKLMLVPLGAKPPAVFQRIHPIDHVIYTHSIRDFYAKPDSSNL